MSTQPGPWTEEAVAALKAAAASQTKPSASEIVYKLRQYGIAVTRSAVIAKLSRMGIPLPGSGGQRTAGPARPKNGTKSRTFLLRPSKRRDVPRSAISSPPQEVVERRGSKPKPLMALRDGQCRWPLGPEYEIAQLFCAAPVQLGHSWCVEHCRTAYTRHN